MPSIKSYLSTGKPLQDEASASKEERVRSVGPYLISIVNKFAKKMNARQRANYDCEDLLLECYAHLLEQDDQWKPERGKYLTFAATVSRNKLLTVRDCASTIHAPLNASYRVKRYREKAANGNITAREARTADMIERVGSGTCTLEGDYLRATQEDSVVEVAQEWIKSLRPLELAAILKKSHPEGLLHQHVCDRVSKLSEAAKELTKAEINEYYRSAVAKFHILTREQA